MYVYVYRCIDKLGFTGCRLLAFYRSYMIGTPRISDGERPQKGCGRSDSNISCTNSPFLRILWHLVTACHCRSRPVLKALWLGVVKHDLAAESQRCLPKTAGVLTHQRHRKSGFEHVHGVTVSHHGLEPDIGRCPIFSTILGARHTGTKCQIKVAMWAGYHSRNWLKIWNPSISGTNHGEFFSLDPANAWSSEDFLFVADFGAPPWVNGTSTEVSGGCWLLFPGKLVNVPSIKFPKHTGVRQRPNNIQPVGSSRTRTPWKKWCSRLWPRWTSENFACSSGVQWLVIAFTRTDSCGKPQKQHKNINQFGFL